MRPADRDTLPASGKTAVLSFRLCGNFVLQVLAQAAPHFVCVLAPIHGGGVLGGRHDDFVLLTRDGQRAAELTKKRMSTGKMAAF